MMFREASPADEPAIIDLLRLSLGNESTEKSVAFWRWKHVDNPFGRSPVLLAVDGERIAGIRAFMRWEWAAEMSTYRALRAVDTATHPDYRGQGIFKKLTLSLIDSCKADGYDFIFNTPNAQSRPGYLKMGWRELGKVPLRIAPYSPTRIVVRLASGASVSAPDLAIMSGREMEKVPGWLDERRPKAAGWSTPVSAKNLQWRYGDCPVRDYASISEPNQFYLVYYLRAQRVGVELRIVHATVCSGREGAARRALGVLLREVKPSVVTCAPADWLPWYFAPSLPLGLMLTFRSLNLEAPVALADWHYSLGDLELF